MLAAHSSVTRKKGITKGGIVEKRFLNSFARLQAILAGKNAQKRTNSANAQKMHKNAPFCTDTCNTPVYYTPVSAHPNSTHFYPLLLSTPKSQRFLRFLRLRCPSRTPEIARFPRQEKTMLHCELRVRWKVASDLRFRAADFQAQNPFLSAGNFGDLAPSTRKSLAIAIVRFWCAVKANC